MTFTRRWAGAIGLLVLAAHTPSAHAADAVADPWLAIEEGWIWQVVDRPTDLAGHWHLDGSILASDVTYEMTLEVTDVEGRIGVFLGDAPCFIIREPGSYRYTFTANDRKRLAFRAVSTVNGRAKLAAKRIRVTAQATTPALAPADPWLAIEEGWIWQVTDTPVVLAGRDDLTDAQLPGGTRYQMTFNATAVEGTIGVVLGDAEPHLLNAPGAYRYTFTADSRKRMMFEAVAMDGGRARLAANHIRVTAIGAESDLAPVRIAYSADGNQHDADDWSASPLALAMLAKKGSGFELVHFDYNNHLGDNDASMAASHRSIVQEAVSRYGFDPDLFFDDQRSPGAAALSLAQAINASSPDDRLYLVCAGPMEMCWRGLNAAMDERLRFVTLITHSWWNNNHDDTAPLAHTLSDIERDFPEVKVLEIGNQNDTAFRSPREDWMWLQQHGADGQWLYEQITAGWRPAYPGDASDAGMVYYVLDDMSPNSDVAAMFDIRALFNE